MLVQKEMRELGCDARTESLLALAMDSGLLPDDFRVSCDGLFVREHSRDLINAEIKEDARKASLLELHLSRGGVYDQLPEGFFFQHREQKTRTLTAADMASDHKENKKKEAEIRRFFLPFENDFFWQRLQIEKEEGRLLEGLQSGILNDYFVQFWNIPRSIPKKFIAPLILLLPYAHRIAGDLTLTAECLEQLLMEEIQIIQKRSLSNHHDALACPGLGDARLGLDMLCGEDFWEDSPLIELVIGPLEGSRISDYLEGGNRFELLDVFRRFFIPAGIDVEFNVKLHKEKENMTMETGNFPILGYSSVL
ncbi:MAG: type VI secretion system baseplate subunit TssG [Puia sp.]